MARRRGFFAELQYQNQLAEKRRLQAEREQARAHTAAVREAERAQRQAESAAQAAARASAAEQKLATREAKRLHEEACRCETEALNAQLSETADEFDSILAATLTVDDYVELEQLRTTVFHPPFARGDLEVANKAPVPISVAPEPTFAEPERPKGVGALVGGKKRHAAAVAEAREHFEAQHRAWTAEAAIVPARQLELNRAYEELEQQRLRELQAARDAYEMECQARLAEATEANDRLDALIAGLAAGQHPAIHEYVGIVLGNSVYPEILSVEHDYEFDPTTRELTLTVIIASPDRLPAEKTFRYVKASDEITATPLAKKDVKARYASVVYQVALRSLHEIFEADRAGHIQTITLTVATEAIDPATGRGRRIAFVGVAAERDSFVTYDLQNVVPSATLEHLGAAVSKNPHELVGIDEAPGVRAR